MEAADLLFKSVKTVGDFNTGFRQALEHLGEMHRDLMIPSWAFPITGMCIIDTLDFQNMPAFNCTKEEIVQAVAGLYTRMVSVMGYAISAEEKLLKEAEGWLNLLAEEWGWSQRRLHGRVMAAKLEIRATGSYTHTSEELAYGAQVAWRNSTKCIGRSAWSTLEVRDRRHVDTPEELFGEICEHLRIATRGDTIQPVCPPPGSPHLLLACDTDASRL